MRGRVMVLAAFKLLLVSGCSPSAVDLKPGPTAVASTGATGVPGGNDAICLAYRLKQDQMARAFINAIDVLMDPSSSDSQVVGTSGEIKSEIELLQAWVETQLAEVADPAIRKALEAYRAALRDDLAAVKEAGTDGHKIAVVLFEGSMDAAGDKVREACGGYGLLPRPTP